MAEADSIPMAHYLALSGLVGAYFALGKKLSPMDFASLYMDRTNANWRIVLLGRVIPCFSQMMANFVCLGKLRGMDIKRLILHECPKTRQPDRSLACAKGFYPQLR